MKYGLDVSIAGEYADPRTLADLAIEAERAGWDVFFVWDVVFYADQPDALVTDPWIALAAIATKTKRIRIGALLTPLARRRPWQVARETVALDHLSNGRLIFGAGLGYYAPDFTTFGENYDAKIRAEKLDEGLEILTGLWSGEPYSFHGKHYQVNSARLLPRPVQSPWIPVWIGGYWPNRKPFRRAAQWDGVYPGQASEETLTPEQIRDIMTYVKEHRRSSVPFDVAAGGETPSDPVKGVEIVQPYLEAGATWWIETINDTVGSFEKTQERIRNGPPRA